MSLLGEKIAKSGIGKINGFTLIELLVTIAIIGVLAGVVLIAIDPAKQIARANDAGGKSDISQIAGAVEAYAVAHNSTYIGGTATTMTGPAEGPAATGTATNWAAILIASGEIKQVRNTGINYDTNGAGANATTFKLWLRLGSAQTAWSEGTNDITNSPTCTNGGYVATAKVYYVYDASVGKPNWFCNAAGTVVPAAI